MAAGPTPTFLHGLKGRRGETTPLIMQQAELGLEEVLLSSDNRNTFFHHPGSGEGSGFLGGKKISPLVNSPNRSWGLLRVPWCVCQGDASSPVRKGECSHSNKTPLSTEETKRAP